MPIRATLLATAILAGTLPTHAQTAPNTLSKQEAAAGWHLLFDGKTTEGWHSTHGPTFPATGWEVKDGLLSVTEHGGEEGGNAGDILSTRKYTNFELIIDFRITPGANSGIKYFVDTNYAPGHEGHGSAIGFEYQILDDALHPDAKKGHDGDRTEASLYDMIPAAKDKPVKPIGEWNTASTGSTASKSSNTTAPPLNSARPSPKASSTSTPTSAKPTTVTFSSRTTDSPSPSATSKSASCHPLHRSSDQSRASVASSVFPPKYFFSAL
jgi:hypothetical protein